MPPPTPPPPPPFLPPNEKVRKQLDEQQVKIQIVLFLTFSIFAMILILGRLRSRGNSIMKFVATKSFLITSQLVSYIPGLMNGPGESNDLYLFWVAFIAFSNAVTNEISCYTLGDNEDRKNRLITDHSFVWPLILTSLYKSLASPNIIVPIAIIFSVIVLKLRERSRALLYATSSSNGFSRSTKIISVFAKSQSDERETGSSESKYFNRLVGVKEAEKFVKLKEGSKSIDFDPSKPEVITLDKVLDEKDTFLSSNVGKELQETCISFSMFWVLLSKIAGYDNVDAKVFKVGKDITMDSFALVEKELEFLYDYLFTNYYAIYEKGIWKKLRDLLVITMFFVLSLPLLIEYRSQDHNILYVMLWGWVLDNGFTRFIIITILVIEYAKIGIFVTSKWAKVMYTCAHLGTTGPMQSRLLQRLIRVACLIPRPRVSFLCFGKFTKRKISQYSILECHCDIPIMVWLKCWIGTYLDLPQIGQAGNWKIVLPSELQESILDMINTCRSRTQLKGKFTNGVNSLKINKIDDATVKRFVNETWSQARIILIWHIATTKLEDDTKKTKPAAGSNDQGFIRTATIISNYCAYLVALHPKMLPDHAYTTQCEFDQVVKELQIELLGPEDDDNEDPNGVLNGNDSILVEATNLEKELEGKASLWKILAEFWTEMLLFLALTNHGEAIESHADSLCVGGEFITHLWALLAHAGCSKTGADLDQKIK